MSKAAELVLTGKSPNQLLEELERIKAWQNGHDYPVHVFGYEGGKSTYKSISDIELIILDDVQKFIDFELLKKGEVTKTGGRDDV